MRLFVAVWPSAEVVRALEALPRPPAPSGSRWTGPEHWHVTLRFLGEVNPEVVGEVEAGVAAVAERLAPVPAVVGPATACFGRSVLMVPVSGLDALAAATVEATAGWGAAPPERRPFVGHLTLARSRRRGPDLRQFAGRPLAASWTASELTLVRSSTLRTGARYEVIRRFALSA
ncbi:MAG: RNA 2',3'-cyclic phosphodiesterase [Actinobacteria bacterium]|nr:RNA 2',3'-cyclic phosphodiesterase [Actinomycetota bacterium]MBW3651957.1 RNA 2',3'-cyclic phosphodiesterase [Actinomycetota bacterium]